MTDRYASLKQGLVGCWIPSISGSGLLLPDLSGRGNNGALTNMDASDWVSSQYGRALDFDGVDDRIVASGNTYLTNGAVSVSGWMRRTGTAGQNNAVVFSKGTLEGNANSTCALYWNEMQGWSWFIVDTANNLTIIRSNTVTSQNQWVHVAGIASSAGLSLYLNGSLANSTTGANVKNSSHSSFIGGADTGGGAFASLLGQTDDIRAYNRILTEPEIRLLASEPAIGFKRNSSAFATRYAYKPDKPRNYSVIRNRDPNYSTLRHGLVAAYCPSISGQGNVLPDLVGGNHGTLTNMDASDWVSSGDGRALDFDGTDDKVTLAMQNTASLTASCWVYSRNINNANGEYFISKWGGIGGNLDFYIGAFSNNWIARTGNGASSFSSLLQTPATANQWTHLAITRDPANLKLFVNGIEMTSTSAVGFQGGGSQALEAGFLPSFYANCQLDDIRIYSRALSESEIKLLASKRGIGLEPRKPKITFADLGVQKTYGVVRVKETDYGTLRHGLVGAWCPSLPNGGSGNTLPDVSGYGNHGVLTNMSPDDWVSGQYGRALDFDGVNDYVLIGSPASIAGAYPQFTKSLWVLLRNTSFKYLFADFNNAGTISRLSIGHDTRFFAFQNTATVATSTTTITTGVWYHVAVTRDDGTGSSNTGVAKIYINGNLESSSAYSFNSPALQISGEQLARSNASFGDHPDCRIDDARIYSRALSEPEIRLLASRPGIGLRQESHRQTFYQFPSGARRKRILTGMP